MDSRIQIEHNLRGCLVEVTPYSSRHHYEHTEYVTCACGMTHYGPGVRFTSSEGEHESVPAKAILDTMKAYDSTLVAHDARISIITCTKRKLVWGCRCGEAARVSH